MILQRRLTNTIFTPKRFSSTEVSWVGANLPFQIQNRYRFLFVCSVYIFTGSAAPFALVRYALWRK